MFVTTCRTECSDAEAIEIKRRLVARGIICPALPMTSAERRSLLIARGVIRPAGTPPVFIAAPVARPVLRMDEAAHRRAAARVEATLAGKAGFESFCERDF